MQMTINIQTFLAEAAPAASSSYGHTSVCAERTNADAEALARRPAR
jgi:hypothetical protein